MRSLTNEKTTCSKCGRKFKSMEASKSPNCFYCELQRYPENPDYRDVAASRINSGTYTEEQEKFYWEGVLKGDPIPHFPGFPEEFDIPRKEMEIELVPFTIVSWYGTKEELEEGLKELFRAFLSISEVIYDEVEDLFILRVPDFIKVPENPIPELNLKYVQQFFATISEDLAKKLGKKVRWGVHFPRYPQFDFETMGY